MKWYVGEKAQIEKARRNSEWRPWFAWYPVALERYGSEMVWLQTIARRMVVGHFCTGTKAVWQYKEIDGNQETDPGRDQPV